MSAPGLSVVLAGGGCRTAWSVGLLEELRDAAARAARVGGRVGRRVHGGRARGALDRADDGALPRARRGATARNVYPERLGRAPVFPHEEIYRATVACGLDAAGMARLAGAGPVRILLAHTGAGARFAPAFWARAARLPRAQACRCPARSRRGAAGLRARGGHRAGRWARPRGSRCRARLVGDAAGDPAAARRRPDVRRRRLRRERAAACAVVGGAAGRVLVLLTRPARPQTLPATATGSTSRPTGGADREVGLHQPRQARGDVPGRSRRRAALARARPALGRRRRRGCDTARRERAERRRVPCRLSRDRGAAAVAPRSARVCCRSRAPGRSRRASRRAPLPRASASPLDQSSSTARPAATIMRASVAASRSLTPANAAMCVRHGATISSRISCARRATCGSGPFASSSCQGPAPRSSMVSHTASTKTRAASASLPGNGAAPRRARSARSARRRSPRAPR